MDERRCDRHDLRRRDIHVFDVLREHRDGLALARPAEHLLVQRPDFGSTGSDACAIVN